MINLVIPCLFCAIAKGGAMSLQGKKLTVIRKCPNQLMKSLHFVINLLYDAQRWVRASDVLFLITCCRWILLNLLPSSGVSAASIWKEVHWSYHTFKTQLVSSIFSMLSTYSNAIILQYACLVAADATHVWKYIKPIRMAAVYLVHVIHLQYAILIIVAFIAMSA